MLKNLAGWGTPMTKGKIPITQCHIEDCDSSAKAKRSMISTGRRHESRYGRGRNALDAVTCVTCCSSCFALVRRAAILPERSMTNKSGVPVTL